MSLWCLYTNSQGLCQSIRSCTLRECCYIDTLSSLHSLRSALRLQFQMYDPGSSWCMLARHCSSFRGNNYPLPSLVSQVLSPWDNVIWFYHYSQREGESRFWKDEVVLSFTMMDTASSQSSTEGRVNPSAGLEGSRKKWEFRIFNCINPDFYITYCWSHCFPVGVLILL